MRDESSRIHDVFLSYSSKDKPWADAACAVLEQHSVRCWIAPRDITPGDEWGAAIIKGLNGSRIMVLIFSGHANASGQVRREVERAISQGMTVLPVRIEDVRPEGAMEYALGNTHWLDAFTPPVQRQLEVLARSVRTLLGHEAESVGDPVPAKPTAVAPATPDDAVQVTAEGPAKTKVSPRTEPDSRDLVEHRETETYHGADPTAARSRLLRSFWPIAVSASLIVLVALGVIVLTFRARNSAAKTTVPLDPSPKPGLDGNIAGPNSPNNDPPINTKSIADSSGENKQRPPSVSNRTPPPGPARRAGSSPALGG